MINFKSSTSEEEEFTKHIVLPVSLTILNLENLEEVHYHAMSPNISCLSSVQLKQGTFLTSL